jgi:hypothetical protein
MVFLADASGPETRGQEGREAIERREEMSFQGKLEL